VETAVDDRALKRRRITSMTFDYEEYLHLVRTRAGWKIVNALWQLANGGEEKR